MKDAITSRLQLFLAKIAGRDVSESTLTPPVIANMEEKLLDEIADRMDAVEEAASSGGDGSGNMVFDESKLSRPMIDGVEYRNIYANLNQSSTPMIVQDVWVMDYNLDNLPPVAIFRDDEDGGWQQGSSLVHYQCVPVYAVEANEESDNLEPCLIADSVIVTIDIGGVTMTAFPSDAKFGMQSVGATNT